MKPPQPRRKCLHCNELCLPDYRGGPRQCYCLNNLAAAQSTHRLKAELKKYINPSLVLIDELGYLPIDKIGADLLFQVFSQRYETGSTIVTTNQPYKNWPKIFNNDSTLTSAVLDRLLHHAETVIVEGRSYRMKDQIETP